MTPSTSIHMVGNAHIDVVWLWPWTEGYQEVRATFRSAVDRVNEHDQFVFTAACALYYRMVEKADPKLFAEIRDAIERKRWYVAGGWWLQPDCNAPSGESFVRQGLYGQRYFEQAFGVTASVGYNVDSFGHHGNLPQILTKLGLSSYVFMRPGKHEKNLPKSLFRWRGIDGSEVTAFRIPPNYNNSSDWGPGLENKIAMVADMAVSEGTPLMCFYGVGNHGGGPTKENLHTIDESTETVVRGQRGKSIPVEVVYSNPGRYFEQVASDASSLPVVDDELQNHAIGCYSVMAEIKRLNNRSEQALVAGEKTASVLGEQIALDYPADSFRSAWERVLFNQFHDTIGGCSIPEAYDDATHAFGFSIDTTENIVADTLQRLGACIDTTGEGTPLLVWNPCTWGVTANIEINAVADQVLDQRGHRMAAQTVPSTSIGNWFTHRTRVQVSLPPLGYRVYRVMGIRTRLDASELRLLQRAVPAADTIQTERLKVTIDRDSGFITSIIRLDTGTEYLQHPGIRPVIVNDPSDTWSHGISSYRGRREAMRVEKFNLVSDGELCTEYEITYTHESNSLVLRLIVYRASETIELRGRVQWNGRRKLLRLETNTTFFGGLFTSEIPYGWIERSTDGREWPIQRWTNIAATHEKVRRGLCIVNDGLYSACVEDNCLALTILRSPIYAHHDPATGPDSEGVEAQYTDQGEHRFNLLLLPHNGELGPSDFTRAACEYNQPARYLLESVHSGDMATEQSFCRTSSPDVMVSTIKRSENNDAYIVRAVETSGRAQAKVDVNLGWLHRKATFDFAPFEIKTIRVSDSDDLAIGVSDLNERVTE